MKRILCVILAIMITATLFVPAFAESDVKSEESVLSINGQISGSIKAGYASIDTSFVNSGSTDALVTMILTEYEDVGGYKRIVSSASEAKLIPAGKTVRVNPGITVSSDDAIVKYFAYETATLKPIAVESFVTKSYVLKGTVDNETIYKIFSFKDISSPVIDNTEVKDLSSPSICTWYGDKASATSITMDDGMYDAALKYLELFKKYGVHGTEMMMAKNIANDDGTLKSEDMVKKWQDIFDTGYIDLGNHSFNHTIRYNNNDYTQQELEHDILDAYAVLAKYFPTQSLITYATPWGQNAEKALTEVRKNHYANRSAGGDIVSGKTPGNFYQIPTIAVQYGTSVSKLNERVDKAIASGGWNTELYHGIGSSTSGDSDYSTNLTNMEEHLKYINSKADKVWAGSFTEVTKYIYERDSASAKQLWATNSSVGIKVTDGVEDDVFDFPLTVKVNVPASWSGTALVKQDGSSEETEVFSESGKNYVYANIIPDKGYAVISK